MARKKNTNDITPNEKGEYFSEREAFEWVEFARELSSYTGIPFTPQLLNSRIKDMTLVTTGGISESEVTSALNDPKNSEDQLLRISEAFEITSTPYKRILAYLANLLAFDLTYYCKNAKQGDYKSTKYQKDLDEVKKFLDRFDYKKEFSIAIKQMFREETFFTVFRDEGEKYVLQQLPSQQCLITGRWDYGLLFSFNFNFFLNSGADINLFPPIFKKTYNKLFTDANRQYNPHLPVDMRNDSSFVYWNDCSPADGFWCWKMTPEIGARIPYFAGLFSDLVNQNMIRGLQKSNYLASSVKFLIGEVPLLKDTKASVADMIAIKPEILAKFLKLIQSAINSEAVRIASGPLENFQGISFDSNNEIYSSYMRTTLGSSGINSNLIFSDSIKPNSTETLLSSNIDELVSQGVYPWFSNFLEYQINKRTKHFKFGFQFEGSNLFTDRKRRFDDQMTLSDKGIVLPQKISASIGMNPFIFEAQLAEARENNWVEKLTPIINAAQMSGKDAAGRPQKSTDDLSDSGSDTRDAGSNVSKGGKV